MDFDVTRPESISAALEASGPIDVLVNNAGIGLIGAFEATPMAQARKVFGRLNKNFTNIHTPVRRLSGGQRQVVAISRAIYFNARILIMDEPCAA